MVKIGLGLTAKRIATGCCACGSWLIGICCTKEEQDRCRGSGAGKRSLSDAIFRWWYTKVARASWSALIGTATKQVDLVREQRASLYSQQHGTYQSRTEP